MLDVLWVSCCSLASFCLKRICNIPEDTPTSSLSNHKATLPRVQQAPQNMLSPRVQSAPRPNIPKVSPSTTNVSNKFKEHAPSTQPSQKTANSPYKHTSNHRYNLRSFHKQTPRSYKARAAEYLVAQQLFEEYKHQTIYITSMASDKLLTRCVRGPIRIFGTKV